MNLSALADLSHEEYSKLLMVSEVNAALQNAINAFASITNAADSLSAALQAHAAPKPELDFRRAPLRWAVAA